MNLWCSFHSFEASFFEGEICSAHLPALDGDLVILPHHTPLLTFLRSGFARFVLPQENQIMAFSLSGGCASITPTHIKILARQAVVFQESTEAPFPFHPLMVEDAP